MYFSLVAADGDVVWVGVDVVCYFLFVSSYGSILGSGAVLYFTLGSLELCSLKYIGGGGGECIPV